MSRKFFVNAAQNIPYSQILSFEIQNRIHATLVEFGCSAYANVTRKEGKNFSTYVSFVKNLQIMYPNKNYRFLLITVCATGLVTK